MMQTLPMTPDQRKARLRRHNRLACQQRIRGLRREIEFHQHMAESLAARLLMEQRLLAKWPAPGRKEKKA